jgi:hypothetical protein
VSLALVIEATRKAGICWLTVPGRRPAPAWFTWRDPDAAAYVVTGPGEQPLPGLADSPSCDVTVPSNDKRGRIVTWTAAIERLRPGTDEWDALVPGMITQRLNLTDPAEAAHRWATSCAVLKLTPSGATPEAGPTLPTTPLSAAVRTPHP